MTDLKSKFPPADDSRWVEHAIFADKEIGAMWVIRQKQIFRSDLQANPEVAYVFGDNMMRSGLGGQAKEMRGEPNAFGIPTKKMPNMLTSAFFTDDDYEGASRAIWHAFHRIKEAGFWVVVVPADGLGTGLAQLDKRAPRIFKFLNETIDKLEDMI